MAVSFSFLTRPCLQQFKRIKNEQNIGKMRVVDGI